MLRAAVGGLIGACQVEALLFGLAKELRLKLVIEVLEVRG